MNIVETKKRRWLLICGVSVFVALIFLSPINGVFEPDSYFHFSISRMTAEQGLVRTIPQLENIGWADNFVDKEFLFHQLTGLGHRIGGDLGVQVISNLLGLSIILILIKLCTLFCSFELSLLIVCAWLIYSPFVFRILLIRPHVSGILLSLIVLWGLIKENKKLLFIGSFLFPLFYHAFYIPILFMGSFTLSHRFRNLKSIFLYGVLPLLAAVVVNPYFPGNVMLTWLGVKLGFSMGNSIDIGGEAKQLDLGMMITHIGSYLILTIALATQARNLFRENSKILPLLLIALTLEALFIISPRALEYLVPILIVLSASTVPYISKKIIPYPLILVVVLLSINIPAVGPFFKADHYINTRSQDMLQLVSNLPADRPEKVFNCEWENGSFVLYERPLMKMVDLLDPNFIYLHNPRLATIKEVVQKVHPPNTYNVLTELFKADYILCWNEGFIRFLESDKRFSKIAVGKTKPFTYLYKISK